MTVFMCGCDWECECECECECVAGLAFAVRSPIGLFIIAGCGGTEGRSIAAVVCEGLLACDDRASGRVSFRVSTGLGVCVEGAVVIVYVTTRLEGSGSGEAV